MEFLLNANIAYLSLVGGISIAILAILNPGTGFLEVIALFALLLAGWEVYNLPFNTWALFVILAGGVLFIFSVRKPRKEGGETYAPWLYLTLAILALVLGSAFLFRSERWWQPSVNPWLALVVSLMAGGFFWLVASKVLEAESLPAPHELEGLIGAVGDAKTDIHPEGSVQIGAELWSARSETPIQEGEQVRVIGREGFVLLVESNKET